MTTPQQQQQPQQLPTMPAHMPQPLLSLSMSQFPSPPQLSIALGSTTSSQIGVSLSKSLQSLSYQLKHSCKHKKFDIKTIQTYGAFRASQLESFKHIKIREESLKELLTSSLKVCYLLEPVLFSLRELGEGAAGIVGDGVLGNAGPSGGSSNGNSNCSNNQNHNHTSPNTLLLIDSIFRVLCQNLFYHNMIKLNFESVDTVVNLVNNRSTQLNCKVVIAGLLAYVSKRLTLEEIGAAMLIFNLEEALIRGRAVDGLPLEMGLLIKCLKKIQRVINVNDLKNFIATLREQQKADHNPILPLPLQSHPLSHSLSLSPEPEGPPQSNPSIQPSLPTVGGGGTQLFMTPDQFLLLVSLSEKKPNSIGSIFFHSYLQSQEYGIDGCSRSNGLYGIVGGMAGCRKKNKEFQYGGNGSGIYAGGTALANNGNGEGDGSMKKRQSFEDSLQGHQQGTQQNQAPRRYNKDTKFQNNIIKAQNIQGLVLYSKESEHIKNIENIDQIYKQIKTYIKSTTANKSRAKGSTGTATKEEIEEKYSKEGKQKRKTQSMEKQMKKQVNRNTRGWLDLGKDNKDIKQKGRPESAYFSQGVSLIQKNIEDYKQVFLQKPQPLLQPHSNPPQQCQLPHPHLHNYIESSHTRSPNLEPQPLLLTTKTNKNLSQHTPQTKCRQYLPHAQYTMNLKKVRGVLKISDGNWKGGKRSGGLREFGGCRVGNQYHLEGNRKNKQHSSSSGDKKTINYPHTNNLNNSRSNSTSNNQQYLTVNNINIHNVHHNRRSQNLQWMGKNGDIPPNTYLKLTQYTSKQNQNTKQPSNFNPKPSSSLAPSINPSLTATPLPVSRNASILVSKGSLQIQNRENRNYSHSHSQSLSNNNSSNSNSSSHNSKQQAHTPKISENKTPRLAKHSSSTINNPNPSPSSTTLKKSHVRKRLKRGWSNAEDEGMVKWVEVEKGKAYYDFGVEVTDEH